MSMEIKSSGLIADLPQSVHNRPREIPEQSEAVSPRPDTPQVTLKPDTEQRLQHLTDGLNARLSSSALKFEVDTKLKTAIIKVVDTQSNKVIRQIPSEEALARLEMIQRYLDQNDYGPGTVREAITGVLLNQQS